MEELLNSMKSMSVKERKALAVLLYRKGVNLFDVTPITPREIDEPLVLSYAQQRQWFLWQQQPDSSAYHLHAVFRLGGALDIEALQDSFDQLIDRHETLRTTFTQCGDQLFQVIHTGKNFSLQVESWQRDNAVDIESRLNLFIETEVNRPFDLEQGPLLRGALLQLAQDNYVLILTLHHIVADGWSIPIMMDELVQFYANHKAGKNATLAELPIQYADYAIWQRRWMELGERDRQLAYWKQQLGGEQPRLNLPSDWPRPKVQNYAGASLRIELESELAIALRQLAKQQGVTLFTLLLTSFQTLLHRYSGQDEIRIGVPTANRNRVEIEPLIGFFVNTLVLKANFNVHMTFSSLVQQIKQTVFDAQANQDLPFEQLVDVLRPERSLSHSPLFQVMYNHQVEKRSESQNLAGLEIEKIEWESRTAQFDLKLDTFEQGDGIEASLTYATALFKHKSIERLARCWKNLLCSIVQQPEQRISELSLLNPEDYQRIVHDWNRTGRDYPRDCSIHQLIEEQVHKTPEAIALIVGEQQLSYSTLNQRANRLAHRLRELGVGPDVLVGIAVERSVEMVVGLLGILKAGGAYVPLDPDYPEDRLRYMMEDSGIQLLLVQSHLKACLPIPAGVVCLSIDGCEEALAGYADTDLHIPLHPDNLAYVIYTSGSTGRPKGAANIHSALVNRLYWMQRAYGLTTEDRVLQKTPFSFDVSVWEFFWPLLSGAGLVVVAPGDHRDPERLVESIKRHSVTTLHFVPSMLQAFMQNDSVASCNHLRRIICSGEALTAEVASHVLNTLPEIQLYNLYGPTEAAIDVTHWHCQKNRENNVPIGRPIDNVSTHVLNSGVEITAPGTLGELYLGGAGLARGYHNRPALTAERFVPNPFDNHGTGGRLYRTGDLARYRPDGVIEYAGRIDHQVKIRGFRIELGEIEARLQLHDTVREAVVIDIDGASGKQLAAYLVLDQEVDIETHPMIRDQLRDHLKSSLPDYMVPSYLLFLDRLPLTPNGKLDRKALPRPDASDWGQVYVAPRTALEQQVAAIWADVLKVDRVGLTDNFFELGGHSLLLLSMKSKIKQVMGKLLDINQLILNPTVQALVKHLDGEQKKSLLVKMNGMDSGIPLFLFHPSFGSVHCYKPIAMALRHTRPVWGIVCQAVVDKELDVPSWDEMVDDYVKQILAVQKRGPYCLAGWSLGGNLAMDVAYKLENTGNPVAFLGWIDAPPPLRVTEFWDGAKPSGPVSTWSNEDYKNLLCVMYPDVKDAINNVWRESEDATNQENQLNKLFSWAEDNLGDEFNILREELIKGDEIKNSREIKRILDLRLQDADYKKVSVPVSCWWASQSKTDRKREIIESSMGQLVGKSKVKGIVIDATHDDIVSNPEFIHSFATSLQVAIEVDENV